MLKAAKSDGLGDSTAAACPKECQQILFFARTLQALVTQCKVKFQSVSKLFTVFDLAPLNVHVKTEHDVESI